MNKESQMDKKSLIYSNNPHYNDSQPILKKEMIYDIDKEKYYLYDKENNKTIQTNCYGRKIPKINNAQVGKATYNERVKSNSIEKIVNNIDDSLYHPRMKYFERFSQIPRPLVKPFSNDIILQSKNDIFNYIKNKKIIISTKKNHKLFNGRNNDNLHELDYYSGTISGGIISKNKNINNNKNKVLQDIDNALNSIKFNQKEIDLINKFKNNLLNNSINFINGKELKKPKDIFKNRYTINHNVMFINPIKDLSINKDLLINLNIYHMLYNSINNNSLTALNTVVQNNIVNHSQNFYTKLSDISKNKKKYKLGRPKSVINIKAKNKVFYNNSDIKKNNFFFLPAQTNIKQNESRRYETEDDYIDIFNKNLNNKEADKTSNNTSTSDILLKNKIHSFVDLKKSNNDEKKLLIGYQKPFIKEIPKIKKGMPRYKSTGELYKKELDMFKIVNPEKIKLEEEENNKRINFLKKKIEKERIIQIVKYKHLIGKKSRVNSAVTNIRKDYNDI